MLPLRGCHSCYSNFFLLFWLFCVWCMHMCLHIHECACAHLFMPICAYTVRRHSQSPSGVFLSHTSSLLLKQHFSLNTEFTNRIVWVASELHGSSVFTSLALTNTHTTHPSFTWTLEIQAVVFMLLQQTFPSFSNSILKSYSPAREAVNLFNYSA